MDKPHVVGITGGIGCGKTAATEYLASQGAIIIDADEISRSLTAEGGEALPRIRDAFGDEVFQPDGTLNRRALSDVVFNDDAARRTLEGVLHPMIQHRMVMEIRRAEEENMPLVFISVPLLFETGMDALCDETWCLTLTEDEQLQRVMERDGLTRSEVQARIRSQLTTEEKAAKANVTIRTNRPMEATRGELAGLYRDLKRRYGG